MLNSVIDTLNEVPQAFGAALRSDPNPTDWNKLLS
jgi:hypothetical protein